VILLNSKTGQAEQVITTRDENTGEIMKVGKSKLTYGTLSQGGRTEVLVNRGKSTKNIIVAEEPEIALSVAEALP